jgi:hypothetical protein
VTFVFYKLQGISEKEAKRAIHFSKLSPLFFHFFPVIPGAYKKKEKEISPCALWLTPSARGGS